MDNEEARWGCGERKAEISALCLFRPQHDGQPYCHKPCYGILFGPKGECRQEAWDSGALLPTPPYRLCALFCRSEYRSRGQLHL